MVEKIVSGGQTGVDRAALDFAIAYELPHAGWCPKGRLAVDGPLSVKYLLRETESEGYRQRTRLNVQDSDGTLIVNIGVLDGGTLQTLKFAETLKRPCFIFQIEKSKIDELDDWLAANHIVTLNVAGPREEKRPGIYGQTLSLLREWLGKSE